MPKSDSPDSKVPVPQGELQIAYAGPALQANKVICSMGSTLRLAFLEANSEGELYFRTAVSLGVQDAIELRKLLERMLADVEAEIKEFEASHVAQKNG